MIERTNMASGKSLVTGGTGFIGSHLVEALVGQGDAVRCLVRRKSSPGWVRGMDVEFVHGDCTDMSSLKSAVEGVDRVYHLAGVSKATEAGIFYRVNTRGTENLVRACLEKNPDLNRFVYLSSHAAVGPCRKNGLAVETDLCQPVSHYGKSKRLGEEAALGVRDAFDVVILRACAVYGPRDRDFLPLFRSIGMGVQIGLRGVDQRLSLCYVNDVVSAIVRAGTSRLASGDIFFVSDGNAYTWRDLCRTIASILEVRVIPIHLPPGAFRCAAGICDWISQRSGRPYVFGRERYEEMVQPNWCCDSSKAMTELGLSPSFDLRQGLAATVAWYRAEGWLKS